MFLIVAERAIKLHLKGNIREAIKYYYELLKSIDGKSIMLEAFARGQSAEEEMQEAELRKMLKDYF